MTERFSAALRSRSWGEHARAERSGYLDALVAGTLGLDGYAALVAQHYFIYEVLEQAGDAMRADPTVAAFADPALRRLPALRADLTTLLGPGWRDSIEEGEATGRYTRRLREVCFDWPAGFVAHHYTRYLGDLSGGQYLAAAIRRAYPLSGTDGTRFYSFLAITDPAAYKQAYRRRLDALAWSEEERDRVVAEVRLAYRLNTEVLDELGSRFAAPEPT